MKGINIFIVLLILVFFISNVSADVNGTIEAFISTENDYTLAHGAANFHSGDFVLQLNHDSGGIPDRYIISNIHARNSTNYSATAGNAGDPFNIYYSVDGTTKTELVGYGAIRIYKKSDAGIISGNNAFDVDVIFTFDSIEINSSLSGLQYYILDGAWITIYSYYNSLYFENSPSKKTDIYNNIHSVITVYGFNTNIIGKGAYAAGINHEYESFGTFRNDYIITDANPTSFYFNVTRAGFDLVPDYTSSQILMKNATDDTDYYSETYTVSNTSRFLLNSSDYKYYIRRQVDSIEYLVYDPSAAPTGPSVGTIDLNQTSYTEPELIQIDVELTTYDFTDHSYYIISEVSEDLDYWDNVAGSYNGTTKITTTTATKILEVDTWLYDLPIWIRSRLVDYNKLTGEYTTLDTTPAVLFNPPIPGSIKFGGTVIDSDTNQIISGALVSVDGVTTASDTTNAFGEFLIYLYPGIYTVTTSKTGYQTSTSEDLLMEYDNTWAQIYLTPIGYGNGTLYGNVNDADTGYAIKDVHVIITNATDQIDAYTSSGGYYEAIGLAQSSTYTIQAVKSGYYTYNGSVTTEASGASHKSFNMVQETATPTPTATVLPTTTYPGGEGHEWTNDEIVTMLRVLVPGFFLLMLVFLLMAVMLGIGGNNGNNGQGRSGLSEIWRR